MKDSMGAAIAFTLKFSGGDAANNQIDLYDVSQAILGFQRSLALTTHLVLNGEIITQAPSLKGARILARPPEEGSWELTAVILAGLYAIGTAPKETPLGHVIHSIYDFIVSESLGFHVDYDKSLGKLYKEHQAAEIDSPRIEQHQIDSLIEKCTSAITEIHRPIFKTQSAIQASIHSSMGHEQKNIGGPLDYTTYEYIREIFINGQSEVINGRVTSYNCNTFKGRIYVAAEGRPVAFELLEQCRSNAVVQPIVRSLSVNAIGDYEKEWSSVYFKVFRNTSRSGHLKRYTVIEVSLNPIEED